MINPVYSTQNGVTPVSNQTYRPRQGVFYMLDKELTEPPVPNSTRRLRLRDYLFHPIETFQLKRKLKLNSQSEEPFGIRLAMYKTLRKNLSRKGRKYLYQQLVSNRLTDKRTDDNRTALAHLYSILINPRSEGFKTYDVLEDTLRLLTEPQTITQKFGNLKPVYLESLMQYYNSGKGPKMASPVEAHMLQVNSSATCVASSVMYYMAYRNPAEFTRHISELTSPRLAFYEKASLNEISPEDPSLAAQKLNDYGVLASAIPGTNGAQYIVKVDLPHSGVLRAINQQGKHSKDSRGVVEAAYQAALTRLAVRSYDSGLDMRVNPDGTLDPSKGLEEDRKTLMETIIKDNGGVMSVTYQFTASRKNPMTGQDEPYLLGYYRDFTKIAQDIMKAIDMGEDVIIGYTDTDPSGMTGRINMGHEITITGYERDKKTGRLNFIVADSDDGKSRLVKRSANEIIPKIHHAGLPFKLSHQIWNEINSLNNQYLIPGPEDSRNYNLIATVPPSQQNAFLEEYQRTIQAEEAKLQQQPSVPQEQTQAPSAATPQVNTVPPQEQRPSLWTVPSFNPVPVLQPVPVYYNYYPYAYSYPANYYYNYNNNIRPIGQTVYYPQNSVYNQRR